MHADGDLGQPRQQQHHAREGAALPHLPAPAGRYDNKMDARAGLKVVGEMTEGAGGARCLSTRGRGLGWRKEKRETKIK